MSEERRHDASPGEHIPPWVLQRHDAQRDVRPGDLVVVERTDDVVGPDRPGAPRGELVLARVLVVTAHEVRLAAASGRDGGWWPRHEVAARFTWADLFPDVPPAEVGAWVEAQPRPRLLP